MLPTRITGGFRSLSTSVTDKPALREAVWKVRAPHTLVFAVVLAFFLSEGTAAANIANTKHNFGAFAPAGNIQTSSTSEICVFCHTPHNSAPAGPIWNRVDSGATYNVYASQSLAATLAPNPSTLSQPTGASKLCLSCHDGTI